MNIENFNTLLEQVKAHDDFDMSDPFNCIQGVQIRNSDDPDNFSGTTDERFEQYLGITPRQRVALTMPVGWNSVLTGYTKKQAIHAMETMRDTGTPDWGQS